MRVILMVKPGVEFFALTFALFRLGAVVVLIDPGMGARRLVACLRSIDAEAFIGVPLAHLLRLANPGAFRSVRIIVTVGRRWLWGGYSYARLCETPLRKQADSLHHKDTCESLCKNDTGGTPVPHGGFTPHPTTADDAAAIIFTTGSTGPPKGVLYQHRTFDAQVQVLHSHFGIGPGQIDLATFPLFALFDAALGATAVIPRMDFTRPGHVDPRRIIGPALDLGATNLFGSPALLDRVGRYGEAHGVRLPSLKLIISAGAPVPPQTLTRFHKLLGDEAEIFTPYGATESLPVASIGSREILGETAARSAVGAGTCVGRPVGEMAIRVIGITEDPIKQWSDDLIVPSREIGEIVVNGPVVTREYVTDAEATRRAKIAAQEDLPGGLSSPVWHRMGDVGYFDAGGRLWFCGRKAHRVITRDGVMFTVPCEAIFNQHPAVARSALVGVGAPEDQKSVICIELERSHRRTDSERLRRELLELARANDMTRCIETILFHPRFPVDIRHNAKIFREKLAIWAANQPAD